MAINERNTVFFLFLEMKYCYRIKKSASGMIRIPKIIHLDSIQFRCKTTYRFLLEWLLWTLSTPAPRQSWIILPELLQRVIFCRSRKGINAVKFPPQLSPQCVDIIKAFGCWFWSLQESFGEGKAMFWCEGSLDGGEQHLRGLPFSLEGSLLHYQFLTVSDLCIFQNPHTDAGRFYKLSPCLRKQARLFWEPPKTKSDISALGEESYCDSGLRPRYPKTTRTCFMYVARQSVFDP